MYLLFRNKSLALSLLGTIVMTVSPSPNSVAQSTINRAAPAEKRVTIEPYKGPPIFLDEPTQVAEPTVVERKVLPEKFEGSEQVRVEREIVLYSDNHFEADGAYREYYPNGQLFVEGAFTKGRQSGDWTYYHQNGEVNRKVTFKEGQPEGAWEVHRVDGTLAAKREFSGGRRNGEWIVYDSTGKLPVREEHYANGKQDGVWKTWFPDGKLKQEVSFKEGAKHGPSKEWDEKGEIRADVTYVDNKLDGTATVVLPDGRTVVQKYEAGRLVSKEKE